MRMHGRCWSRAPLFARSLVLRISPTVTCYVRLPCVQQSPAPRTPPKPHARPSAPFCRPMRTFATHGTAWPQALRATCPAHVAGSRAARAKTRWSWLHGCSCTPAQEANHAKSTVTDTCSLAPSWTLTTTCGGSSSCRETMTCTSSPSPATTLTEMGTSSERDAMYMA